MEHLASDDRQQLRSRRDGKDDSDEVSRKVRESISLNRDLANVTGSGGDMSLDVALVEQLLSSLQNTKERMKELQNEYNAMQRASRTAHEGFSLAREEYDREVSAHQEAENRMRELNYHLVPSSAPSDPLETQEPTEPQEPQEPKPTTKPAKQTPAEMVLILGKLIQEETSFMVKMLPKARIPIIKLLLPPSAGQPFGLSCDIGFESQLALENTRLLLTYSIVDPWMRTIVLFLKVWTKRRRINNPYLGTLSSYGYVLLVIYYLVNGRKEAVLPYERQEGVLMAPPSIFPAWKWGLDPKSQVSLQHQGQHQATMRHAAAISVPTYPPLTARLMQDHVYRQATTSTDVRPQYPPESLASEPAPLD
ncbi:uncharacterized protein MELLADRAFT_88776 [Melampsora larici-populina 98AG31]|uniref:Poly(A) RNA polymerase mitochondrial-like central palm domain-containing protein n=1 Tax=Melampsora larici-populina (strain 98AG31 / pathotype 3-4-7) TaxID=747676 RepID=F4RSY5_MELLP|nr:uncharacterized protein MELLADRAFT_88776 [Melampsora larici-populina 98AG31]EGG04410.1 hypothetical protein MELLADRAFT_88776 [Melampsora larici-populina 98AG31]